MFSQMENNVLPSSIEWADHTYGNCCQQPRILSGQLSQY